MGSSGAWGVRASHIVCEWLEESNVNTLLNVSRCELRELHGMRILQLLTFGVERLSLSCNRLSSLPETFGQLTALTILYLNDNELTTLPEAMGQLTNLTLLKLQHNFFSSLPAAVVQLTNLKGLWLDGNLLSSLPETVGRLANLEDLSLDNNMLTFLPESIGQLSKLKKLCLSRNKLSTVPEAMGQLTDLKKLQLNHNLLASLPDTMKQLTNLKTLNLSNNQMSSFDEVAELLKRSSVLVCVNVPDNPGSKDLEVARAFACALRSNASLTRLSLSEWHETTTDPEEVGEEIQTALARNTRGDPAPEPYHPMVKSALKRGQ